MHKWSHEEITFLRAHSAGLLTTELTAIFNKHFGLSISAEKIRSVKKRYKIKNGINCRFKKGNIPVNKGKKGCCAKGCEKSWFKKGHTPINHKAVGSERIDSKDGYILIKTHEPNKWRLKHRVVYEENFGPIPKDCLVVFKDGDKQNTDTSNLMLVTKAEHAIMNRYGFNVKGENMTELCKCAADLIIATRKAQCSIKRKRKRV